MKKIISLTIISLSVFSSHLYANELLGTYTTKPEIFPGFDEPYSEVVIKAIERMTWKMEITAKEIIIWIKPNSDPLVIPYITDGKYLLGTNTESKIKVFMPLYVENNQTIHGNNTVFYKINE